MTGNGGRNRLAVDIGGTFTDVALEAGSALFTTKVLTTPEAPDEAVMDGTARVLADAGLAAADLDIAIHGTTLATNAIIERKGARTALVATRGFRDAVEMAYENRFDQYDINVEKPVPLVPRYLRLEVAERLSARGRVLQPLDEASVHALLPVLDAEGAESVAICLLHSYADDAHERRVAEILAAARPGLWITRSSEVCPEIREYERQSTACANAYVQPLMARYLRRLEERLAAAGSKAPLYLMMSGGGLTTVGHAIRAPIRLVESGPAGGAILACRVAAECGLDEVLSYDMGGTTAKICLIDRGRPQSARTFEVDRVYRFAKGSGLPLRIPVIEMVEIGAGGGSIARVDAMRRITVGPDSAGAAPGPACYGRGGTAATVTDADVVLGRLEPELFAGGSVTLVPAAAREAVARAVGEPLGMDAALAAFGLAEVVDENMGNAARVHAIENGKDVGRRTLVAFGGAAPLHACRLAEKLGIGRIVVPTGAGVGSALGFLSAPVAYELVQSRYQRLSDFDAAAISGLLDAMSGEARAVVKDGAAGAALTERRSCYMRYVGQGHEIEVELPGRALAAADVAALRDGFDAVYTRLYGRTIPHMDVEILTWAVTVSTTAAPPARAPKPRRRAAPPARRTAPLFDSGRTDYVDAAVWHRDDLKPGTRIEGPALIVEAQTTTVVAPGFLADVDGLGYIVMERVQSA